MSPTQYCLRRKHYERECEEARQKKDIPGMQRALGKLTELRRAMYGVPMTTEPKCEDNPAS